MASALTCSPDGQRRRSRRSLLPQRTPSRCCSRHPPFSGTEMSSLGFVTGIAPRDRTLVVIFLRGGADWPTLVAPIADDAYRRARPTLRVSERDGLRLDDVFALHPRLAPLVPLW